jgi:fructose-bisphosphate aldolase class II
MARSRAEGFAVGAFNVDNLETLRAIAQAATTTRAPVLFEVSESEVAVLGLANIRAVADNYIHDLGIEAYLNLDHAPSVDLAFAAVDLGFEFVHIDLSQADHTANNEQIIAGTRQVVDYAKSTGALVESELRWFAGSSNVHDQPIDEEALAGTLTDPAEARAFVEATGIDTFAVAIGNLHGRYPTPPSLDLDRLHRIRDAVDVNLSLHGGSGMSNEQYQAAATGGISKINVNSDIRYAFRTALEVQLDSHRDEYAVVKLMPPVIDAVQEVVEWKIQAFGSGGRATHS